MSVKQLPLEMAPLLARLEAKVERGPGCWIWQGCPRGDGYGQIIIDGYHWGAHRLAYTLWVGPIPDGLTIDHLCRQPLCVKPAHMEPVTKRENTLRGNGITAQQARRTHCPRGHAYDEANTRVSRNKRHCRACSVLFKDKPRSFAAAVPSDGGRLERRTVHGGAGAVLVTGGANLPDPPVSSSGIPMGGGGEAYMSFPAAQDKRLSAANTTEPASAETASR